MPGCPQHRQGKRKGVSTKAALVNHIKTAHPTDIHRADMQLCQEVNVHICPQCPCAVFHNEKKLANHHRTHHQNTRVSTNKQLCKTFIQGATEPNYVPIWEQALKFILTKYAPDPATFRSGVAEKITPVLGMTSTKL